jgi:hypothetical protein
MPDDECGIFNPSLFQLQPEYLSNAHENSFQMYPDEETVVDQDIIFDDDSVLIPAIEKRFSIGK